MFSSSGAGNVDLTGYNNKKFTTSFPAWRSKTPTGGHIAFGITQDGPNDGYIYDKVTVYCMENTHKNYLNSPSYNYLFKYVYGVDRVDKKKCYVQFGFIESVKGWKESVEEEEYYRTDISEAVCSAGSFWYDLENGFSSIFEKSITPEICKKTRTDYRITSNGLFIIKDDKPIKMLCDEGYGCTL